MLGVYPSALHVRWSRSDSTVGALAVDVEPTVFWDGRDAEERVEAWKRAVDFDPEWGSITSAGNGTSGDRLRSQILDPLGLAAEDVWFSDLLPWFFVKKRAGENQPRQQLDVIDEVYAPFAARAGLPPANLPLRPSIPKLCSYVLEHRREHLRNELLESGARVLITLGEEPRSVVERISDRVGGRVTTRLSSTMREYEHAGWADIAGRRLEWWALKHPGQRSPAWMALHQRWVDRSTTSSCSRMGRRGCRG